MSLETLLDPERDTSIPGHLSIVDGGRLRCDECGTTGIRPMHHTEECTHEHVPVREGDADE